MAKPNGVILWQGLSQLDRRSPLVVIATGLRKASSNSKTGGMVQTWILRADVSPYDAIMTGADAAICGGCVHRADPVTNIRTCYVNVARAPLSIWNAYKRGSYSVATPDEYATLFGGKAVRFGAYGDPAAAPLFVWENIAKAASLTTGYTHQWRSSKFAGFAQYCQASCETSADVTKANRKGFGSFHVVAQGADIPSNAFHCPASAEAGKTTDCETCGACNGRNGYNVAIHAHGSTAKRYLPTL